MKSSLLLLFFGMSLLAFPLSGADSVWRFSNGPEFRGASGALDQIDNAFCLRGDFSKGGSYVAMVRDREIPDGLLLVRFRVDTAARQIAVRVTDSDGQTHQHFLPLSGKKGTTQDVIGRVSGSPEHHWGGKNDGILRPPVKAVQIVTHRGDYADNRAAELKIADLHFDTAPAGKDGSYVLAETPDAGLSDWRTGGGGRGTLRVSEPGVIRLETDFTGVDGGQFVTAARNFTAPLPLNGVRFQMRGDVKGFDVRFVDSGYQIHQFYLIPSETGEFKEFIVPATGSDRHWNGANDGVLRQPIRAVEFGVHGWQQNGKRAALELSGLQFLTPDSMAASRSAFDAAEPEKLFRTPEDRSPVVLRLRRAPELPKDVAFRYYYTDYQGALTASGTGSFDPAGLTLSAPPPPGRGFAELVYPALGIRAGVMTDDPAPAKPDEFFAIDSSFSWGAPPNTEAGIRSYLRILKRCGILWNRDRISWGKVAPAPDRFDFGGRFGLYRRVAAEEGIRTLDVFHDTPGWLAPNVKPEVYGPIEYPSKLKAAGNNWAGIAEHWSGTLNALEVWNEPDLKTYPFPDQISSFTKAMSRVMRDRGADTVIVGGVFAHPWPGTAMQDAYLANGMLEAVDAMSYHTYAGVTSMESTVGGLRERELALRHPRAGIPIWITECGTPWTAGGDRAVPTQDMFSASEIVGKAVEFKALGVERYFAFEFKFYQEGLKNFGMMDANGTPMRSMAAYGHAAKVLAGKEYIGDLTETDAIRARVFSDGTDAVAALYTGTGKKRPLTLPPALSGYQATGIDGRPAPVVNGTIACDDGVVYLQLPERTVRPCLKNDTTAMKYCRPAREFKRVPRATPPVVFRSLLDVSEMTYDAFGYNLRNYENAKFTVELCNLSDRPQKAHPALELPEGCRVLEFADREFELMPGSTAEFSFRLAFDPAVKRGQWRLVRVIDRSGNALPLAFSIRPWKMEVAPVPAATPESEKFDLPTLLAAGDWVDFSSGDRWRSWQGGEIEPNIAAKFRAFHTSDALQIQVLVKDRSFHQPYGAAEAWRGDSLQLAFQQRGADGMPPAKRYWNEITAAKTGDKGTIYGHRGNPAGLYHASALRFIPLGSDYWLYVLDLDARETKLDLSHGSKIGFSLLVDSNSGKGRDGFLAWGDGIAGNKDHSVFNCLEVK